MSYWIGCALSTRAGCNVRVEVRRRDESLQKVQYDCIGICSNAINYTAIIGVGHGRGRMWGFIKGGLTDDRRLRGVHHDTFGARGALAKY